jgi:hypothetical protein
VLFLPSLFFSISCIFCHSQTPSFKTPFKNPINKTSWSLLGPGVEVGLTPNSKKGIHIFLLLICWVIFLFFFLPSKLDGQCMVIAKKEQNKFFFQFLKNWCSINIINNAKWVKDISIHIFIKNKNSVRCVMTLKVMFVLILWLVLEIETPKSN